MKCSIKKIEDSERLPRFNVVTSREIRKLINPVKEDNVSMSYVHKHEIFKILYETHLGIGRGG